MSQNDFTIANQGFPAFRADLNGALQALATVSAGDAAPTTTFAYMLWYDSTNDILKMRNADDDAWITLFTFNQATDSVAVSGEELVDDTTPQLGGNLDLNSNNITGTGDITITGIVTSTTDTDTTNTGNVTLDFSANQNFVLTLTGAVTLDNPTTESVGQSGFIVFIQDGTGGRTVSLGTDYETAGAAGLTLSSAASTTDIVPYIVAASGRILLGAPQLAFA